MNKIIIIGRVTATPSIKSTANGKNVTDFTVACRRTSNRERTDFFKCVAWEHLAEIITAHVKKGDLLSLVGELQNRNWEDADGNKRQSNEVNVAEIEFLQKKEDNSGYFPDEPAPEFLSDDLPT